MVFPTAYAIAASLREEDRVVFLRGKIDRTRELPNRIVEQVIPLEQMSRLTRTVSVTLSDKWMGDNGGTEIGADTSKRVAEDLQKVRTLLSNRNPPNGSPYAGVTVEVRQRGEVAQLRLDGVRVAVDDELSLRIDVLLGVPGCCRLVGSEGGPASAVFRDNLPPREAPRKPPVAGKVCPSVDRY